MQAFNIELTLPNEEQQIVEASIENVLSSNEAIHEIEFSDSIKKIFCVKCHLFRVINFKSIFFLKSNT